MRFGRRTGFTALDMTRSRNRTALSVSIVLHAAVAAAVLGTLHSSPVQIRIESIEAITDSAPAESKHAITNAKARQFAVHPALPRPVAAAATEPAPLATNSEIGSARAVNAAVMSSYLEGVRAKLSSALRIPPVRPSSPLRILLKLTLLESGEVRDPSIDQSSGSAEIDRSVMEALERAKPFSRFSPDMASVHQITLKLPIEIRPRR